jgi:hypothetical protein
MHTAIPASRYSKCNTAKCSLARFDNPLLVTKLVSVGYSLADQLTDQLKFFFVDIVCQSSLAHTTWGVISLQPRYQIQTVLFLWNITLAFEQKYKPPGRNLKELYIRPE